MTAPTLATERLSMRALTKATQTQVAWLRDPEVVRFSEQRHREHTLSSQLRYINAFGESYLWGIYTVHDGAHIGNMSASIDQPNKTADVGILIGETKYWRKGYGLEAWREACRWMLDPGQGALRKLEAGCMATNLGMRRILDKSGFKLEGERLNHFLLDGSPVGMVFYGRFK